MTRLLFALAIAALMLSWCARQSDVHAANRQAPKPDPLLGKWVMIADNGGGGNGTIADFRPDGTVEMTQKGKSETSRYVRESGQARMEKRAPCLKMKADDPALK